jgi:propionaldehyde dehydrogenase
MPILPIVRTTNLEQAITYAVEAEHNNKHTAMIHSQNIQNITKFANSN